MGVHPAAVIAKERLGHEARRLAVLTRHVLDHILVNHHGISRLDQGFKAVVNLRLTRRGHLMMLPLDGHAQLFHHQAHLGPDVLLCIGRRDGEIPFLVPDLVSGVGHFLFAAIPDPFLGINAVEGAVGLAVELHVVEDEELRFRPHESRVGQAGADEVFLRPLGNAPRVARVGLFGSRLRDGARQAQGRHGAERVNKRRRRVRHRQHVRGLDALPAADAGAVEAQALGEDFLSHLPDGTTEMLPGAKGVDELDVHHLGPALFC